MSRPTKEMLSHWEQLAYTDGHAAARAKKPFDECPFDNAGLVKAWRAGHTHAVLKVQLVLPEGLDGHEVMRIATRERCGKCFGAVGIHENGKKLSFCCIIDRRITDCGGPYSQYEIFEMEEEEDDQ